MSQPPNLTGNARTDRALVTLARLLAEIADGRGGSTTSPDGMPAQLRGEQPLARDASSGACAPPEDVTT